MLSNIVALAGQTGSGKTSLGRELSRRLGATFTSFGSFVRVEAERRGIPPNRLSLQALGQDMVHEYGPDEFVRKVLELAVPKDEASRRVMVLDGVRTTEVWHSIQKLACVSRLVYLDIDVDTRIERVRMRDRTDLPTLHTVMDHQLETSVPSLRVHADVILRHGSIDILANQVIEDLASRDFI